MAIRRRTGKKLFKSMLPIVLLILLALAGALGWIIYGITRPPRRSHLVTPEGFAQISGSGKALKITEESWSNRDGTLARGWLLRGNEGAPVVIFLHRYGGDRSLLFNLGMKVNEATNFSILWPDMRGHGLNPPVKWTTFGSLEGNDVLAALDFVRSLKSENKTQLIGNRVGIYGVELGAYAAMLAASKDPKVEALVLDSVPLNSDEMVSAAVAGDLAVNTSLISYPARVATKIYFMGEYHNQNSCELAPSLANRSVLLLAGADDGYLRESTKSLIPCFPNASRLETKTDLPLTGFTLPSATGVQGESYDRPVIDFFVKNLEQ